MKNRILALTTAFLLGIPGVTHAIELEEITVYGVDLTSTQGAFQVALSTVILVHEYNEKEDTWEFIEARDTSEEKEEES